MLGQEEVAMRGEINYESQEKELKNRTNKKGKYEDKWFELKRIGSTWLENERQGKKKEKRTWSLQPSAHDFRLLIFITTLFTGSITVLEKAGAIEIETAILAGMRA